MPDKQCPQCEGKMERGFAIGGTPAHVHTDAKWVEGSPRKGIRGGIILGGRRKYAITAYRCTECGYLELYAK